MDRVEPQVGRTVAAGSQHLRLACLQPVDGGQMCTIVAINEDIMHDTKQQHAAATVGMLWPDAWDWKSPWHAVAATAISLT